MRVIRAPPGSPGGTFTLSNVPGGRPRRPTSAASCRAKAAAERKSGWPRPTRLMANEGKPITVPSIAAATVPEYRPSMARFAPRLMPLATTSGRLSRRRWLTPTYTASVGVPSTANRRTAPQGDSSSIRSGRCSEMLWLEALCSRSGATTVTSPSGISASASARRPAASTPASVLARMRTSAAWPSGRAQATRQVRLPAVAGRLRLGNIRGMAEASESAVPLPRPLPPAPARLVDAGAPVEGTWAGALRDTSFAGLAGEYARGLLERRLVEKRWQALFLATPRAMLSFAIVDAGYLSSGFLSVFDRGARRLLIDSNPVLPPFLAWLGDEPNDGMRALLTGPRISARIERSGGRAPAPAPRGDAPGGPGPGTP